MISGTPPPKVNKVGRTVKVDSAKKITMNKCVSDEVVTVESDSGLCYTSFKWRQNQFYICYLYFTFLWIFYPYAFLCIFTKSYNFYSI